MCLSMMRNQSTPTTAPTVSSKNNAKKKKPTLLNQKGGGKDSFSSPTSGVDVGNAGSSGFDGFGNAPK